jgi:hypothetical protein
LVKSDRAKDAESLDLRVVVRTTSTYDQFDPEARNREKASQVGYQDAWLTSFVWDVPVDGELPDALVHRVNGTACGVHGNPDDRGPCIT